MTHADTRSGADHGTDGLSGPDASRTAVSCHKQRDTRNCFAAHGGLQVPTHLSRLPSDATHIVLSTGGNNALMQLAVLHTPVSSVAQALEALAEIASDFKDRYRSAVAACVATRVSLAVCTIYNGCFDDPSFQRIASATLMLFNDAIIRVAAERGVPIIDLRSVCSQPEDYANPIEPSSVGGEKIARIIVELVSGVRVASTSTRIIVA